MTEGGLLLLQRWWWWWWWCSLWVCLTTARVAPAAAAGQGQCEVLDLSIKSTFSLPTNLTVKPTAPGWLLDFVLEEGAALPAACVRIQHKESKMRLMLYKGDCKDGMLMDYTYPQNLSMTPHAWSTLGLDVKNNAVLVKGPGADTIQLKADSLSLSSGSLHVTAAQDVQAAVGCRVNCPQYIHASEGPDKKMTVKRSRQDNLLFYFRPGEKFVRLEYEVTCTTTLGNKLEPHIADIVPPDHLPKGLWHLVDLQHRDGMAQVSLDYKFLKKMKLPTGCTFTEQIIRVVGDSHFSFSCNPSTGAEEWVEDHSWECSASTQASAMSPWEAVGLTLLAETCLVLVVSIVVVNVKKVRHQKAKEVKECKECYNYHFQKHDTNDCKTYIKYHNQNHTKNTDCRPCEMYHNQKHAQITSSNTQDTSENTTNTQKISEKSSYAQKTSSEKSSNHDNGQRRPDSPYHQ